MARWQERKRAEEKRQKQEAARRQRGVAVEEARVEAVAEEEDLRQQETADYYEGRLRANPRAAALIEATSDVVGRHLGEGERRCVATYFAPMIFVEQAGWADFVEPPNEDADWGDDIDDEAQERRERHDEMLAARLVAEHRAEIEARADEIMSAPEFIEWYRLPLEAGP